MGHDLAYGLGHVAELVRAINAQVLHIAGGAHRVVNYRTFPGQEFEVEAHALQG